MENDEHFAFDALSAMSTIECPKLSEPREKLVRAFARNEKVRKKWADQFKLIAAALRAYHNKRPYSVSLTALHHIADEAEAEKIGREAFFTIFGRDRSGDPEVRTMNMWERTLHDNYDPISNSMENSYDPALEDEQNLESHVTKLLAKDLKSFTRRDIHTCIKQVRAAVPGLKERRKLYKVDTDDKDKQVLAESVIYKIGFILTWAEENMKWEVYYGVLSDSKITQADTLATMFKSSQARKTLLHARVPDERDMSVFRSPEEAIEAHAAHGMVWNEHGEYIPRTGNQLHGKLISLLEVRDREPKDWAENLSTELSLEAEDTESQ